jgi:RNA polymerase sigma factor (sigma-70 family)
MSEVTDNDLLERFKRDESDEAFAGIVERYINLVYSVALRHTANPHHAEEITQAVFIILARRAGFLSRGTILSGWLYRAARLTAANFIRSEMRRSKREQQAFMQSSAEAPLSHPIWAEFSPLLDAAMARLSPTDRDALVLRYFENKSLQEVGQALGIEERAAQKRVGRALEKLRSRFARRGVVAGTAIIAAEISTHAVQAAPLGLPSKIAAVALKGYAAAGSTLTLVKGTLQIMTWLKAKTVTIYGSVALLAVGASLAVAHHICYAGNENQAKAAREKLEAERQAGFANVAQDPDAQKLEAEQREKEQKALRLQQEREQREKDQRALRLQEGQH